VRLIVGFPAGGAADIIARTLGYAFTQDLGQQVIIDNRAGAGGSLGSEITAKAEPDGYTILMISSSYAANAALYRQLRFDPIKALAPVTLVASAAQVLLANPNLPFRDIKALIAEAKASPGKLNYASAGTGSTTHLAGELFKLMADVNLTHIPYKGGSPALTDLIGGQVQLLFLAIPPALAQIRAAKVRAIAVTSSNRAVALPDVPTVAESGVAGYEATNWYGILAPAAIPTRILSDLENHVVKLIRLPEVSEQIVKQGAEPVGSSAKEFSRYLISEIAKWSRVVKQSGIHAD